MSTFLCFPLICLPDKQCNDRVESKELNCEEKCSRSTRSDACFFFSMTPRRAHCGCPWCYQATTIKEDFTQRWLAYLVLSRYSPAIVLSVRFSVMFAGELWVSSTICFSFSFRSLVSDCTAGMIWVICCRITSRKWWYIRLNLLWFGLKKKVTDFYSLTVLSNPHNGYEDAHHQGLRDAARVCSVPTYTVYKLDRKRLCNQSDIVMNCYSAV